MKQYNSNIVFHVAPQIWVLSEDLLHIYLSRKNISKTIYLHGNRGDLSIVDLATSRKSLGNHPNRGTEKKRNKNTKKEKQIWDPRKISNQHRLPMIPFLPSLRFQQCYAAAALASAWDKMWSYNISQACCIWCFLLKASGKKYGQFAKKETISCRCFFFFKSLPYQSLLPSLLLTRVFFPRETKELSDLLQL